MVVVPAGAKIGSCFARFRFSSVDTSFGGDAPDGEVEDYQAQISHPPIYGLPAEITVTRNTGRSTPKMINLPFSTSGTGTLVANVQPGDEGLLAGPPLPFPTERVSARSSTKPILPVGRRFW